MSRVVTVHLGAHAEAIGELRYDRDGRRETAAFAYTRDWLDTEGRFAIDPDLPLVEGFQFHGRRGRGSLFHGAIADTEPDGWGRRVILRDHGKRRHAARASGQRPPGPLGELDFLLSVDDESRVGALRFRGESADFQATAPPGSRRAPPLLELRELMASSRAVELSEETAADLAYLRGRGTSLGGLRPKCSVRDENGHLAVAKFPSVSDERSVPHGEVLALELARRVGISAAVARVVNSDGLSCAVVRRFDRTATDGRIPYVSAATLLGVERDDPEEHSYAEIADAIRIHGHDAKKDIEELFRRIAFNIAINNVDDHLQNHGFLHVARGQWQLSPAFDLNPFPDRLGELKTWISPDTGPTASTEALLSVAPHFGLRQGDARAVLSEVEAGVSTWREVARALAMTGRDLDAYAEAFE